MLVYRVMDPKTVSITSVTIINTLSFRTMYIQRWWKSKYIMILHIVHHYIPYNKIKAKNHKKYIFKIGNILGRKNVGRIVVIFSLHRLSRNQSNLTGNFALFAGETLNWTNPAQQGIKPGREFLGQDRRQRFTYFPIIV